MQIDLANICKERTQEQIDFLKKDGWILLEGGTWGMPYWWQNHWVAHLTKEAPTPVQDSPANFTSVDDSEGVKGLVCICDPFGDPDEGYDPKCPKHGRQHSS